MTQPKEHFSSYLNDLSDTPLHAEGDFLSPEYDNPVKEITYQGKPERHEHVVFHRQEVTMKDDTRYIVVNTEIPEKYQQNGSDIANIETTAWTTKADGLNKRRMHTLARMAMPTVFIGVQQNILRRGHIDKNAHNQIEIAKSLASTYNYSKEHAVSTGISRGGMTTLNVGSVALQHDMRINYVDSTVAVRPDGLDLPNDIIHLLKALPGEAKALAALREVPLKNLYHYRNSIDLSPRGVWQQLKEIPTMLSGEVGRQIDQHMPQDSFGYIASYEGDMFGPGSAWKNRFNGEDYPNMIVDSREGGAHMFCALNDSYGRWLRRMQAVSEVLHEDTNNRHLGGTAFRALAAERNWAFLQPHEQDNEIESFRLQKAILEN